MRSCSSLIVSNFRLSARANLIDRFLDYRSTSTSQRIELLLWTNALLHARGERHSIPSPLRQAWINEGGATRKDHSAAFLLRYSQNPRKTRVDDFLPNHVRRAMAEAI